MLDTNGINITTGSTNIILRIFRKYFQLIEVNSANVRGDFSKTMGSMRRAKV